MKARLLTLLALLLPAIAGADEATDSPLVEAARAGVLAQLGSSAASVSLQAVTTSRRGPADARTSYHARPVDGHFPRARFSVMVDVLRDGRKVGTVPVGFVLSESGPGLVYRHAEHAGMATALLDTETGMVDAARAVGALHDLSAQSGMRLRHSVRAGAPVLASDFEAVPDVDNRSTVRLQATFGAITVESPATAMRSGNRGDKVPVMVSGASGPVTALVVDKGVTRIER